MNTRFRLDFRFLEQKSTRGCWGVPSERIRADPTGSTSGQVPQGVPFGFRNRKFAAIPVERGGIYHFRCAKKAEMNVSDARQMEKTKFARHEEQVMSGQSENRLKNLEISSNSGSLRK